jgi:hypothetical protein
MIHANLISTPKLKALKNKTRTPTQVDREIMRQELVRLCEVQNSRWTICITLDAICMLIADGKLEGCSPGSRDYISSS